MADPMPHASLARAAAPTLRAIRREAKQALTEDLRLLLEQLAERIFEVGLTAEALQGICGLRDHGLPARFRRQLGTSLAAYIRRGRLETAERLLEQTDLPLFRIAGLVGFGSATAFSRAFLRWRGRAPSTLRKRRGKRPVGLPESRALRYLLYGAAPAGEAARLCERLLSRSGAAGGGSASALHPLPETSDLALRLEKAKAEALWQELRGRAHTEQAELVREHVRFTTPALFQLLVRKSRKAGREQRSRALPLAELAVDSLQGLEPACVPAQVHAGLCARAWAELAHARRRAFDLPGAERAVAHAEALLSSSDSEPLACAEVAKARAALLGYQRHHKEALEVLTAALLGLRQHGSAQQLGEALVLRGTLLADRGEGKQAVPDYEEALRRIDPDAHPYLFLSAAQNLAAAYARMGRHREALRLLPRARRVAEDLGFRDVLGQLHWVEGYVAREQGRWADAEAILENARQELLDLGQIGDAAVITLDLAIVNFQQGNTLKVLEHVADAVPVFEALANDREALVSIAALRQACEGRDIPLPTLLRARASLWAG